MLVTFGFIAAFIAVAFMPPSGESIVAYASDTLASVLPEAEIALEKAGTVARSALTSSPVKGAWEAAKQSADPRLIRQLERIEWATRRNDIRACVELLSGDAPVGTTPGDYLALCLARVTQSDRYCSQIDSRLAPFLRVLCDEELKQ